MQGHAESGRCLQQRRTACRAAGGCPAPDSSGTGSSPCASSCTQAPPRNPRPLPRPPRQKPLAALAWWTHCTGGGALTTQFQEIAANALKDANHHGNPLGATQHLAERIDEGHRYGQPPGGPGCAKPAGSGPCRAGRQTCCGPAQGAVSFAAAPKPARQICWQPARGACAGGRVGRASAKAPAARKTAAKKAPAKKAPAKSSRQR